MQATGELQDGLPPPEPNAVRGQLSRILTSPDFNVPERVRRFLTFVIEETLAGRSDRIKAYSIATHVFGRSDDFDVLNDPVVRIEAGRLRRALERYYLTSGRTDPVLVDIPKGTYVPIFRRQGTTAPASETPADEPSDDPTQGAAASPEKRRWRPISLVALLAAMVLLAIAATRGLIGGSTDEPKDTASPDVGLVVSPFANLSGPEGALYSAGISDELLSQLARFRELRVMGREAARPPQRPDITSQQTGVHYLLEGGVRAAGQHLRVSARLLDWRTSRILWSQVYDRDLKNAGSFEIESDIAAKVAAAVAQPYGAIFTPVSREESVRVPDSVEAYLCVLRFYQYRKVLNREEHASTRDCLERTTARYPDYSTGWAMLGYLYLDEDRFDLNRRLKVPAGRIRARDAAERAISLDPSNVRGLQALMTISFFSREPEKALRAGEKAIALNPNDTETLAEFGSRIAQSGDWRRGVAMMEDALARNPAQSSYYVGLVAQAYYMLGDDKRALEWIRRADLKRFSIYHFVAALIFDRSGLEQEARASVAEFLKMRPRFFDNFDAELAMRNFNARDRARLIEGARQAGFPIGAISQ